MDGHFVFFRVCILSHLGAVIAITSTCHTGSVAVGETATVTCHLGEDVKSQGHDIIVQRGEKNIRYLSYVVMQCYWPDDRKQGYKCVTYRNFTRTTDVTETVTIALPNAQKDAEGLYYCEVMADEYRYKPCNLSIGTNEPRVPPTPVPADGPERRDAGGIIPLWVGIGLGLVVGSAVIAVVAVWICVCIQKRRSWQPVKIYDHKADGVKC